MALAREQLIFGKLTHEKNFFECCIAVQRAKAFCAARANSSLSVELRDHFHERAHENLVTLARRRDDVYRDELESV